MKAGTGNARYGSVRSAVIEAMRAEPISVRKLELLTGCKNRTISSAVRWLVAIGAAARVGKGQKLVPGTGRREVLYELVFVPVNQTPMPAKEEPIPVQRLATPEFVPAALASRTELEQVWGRAA